MATPPSTRSVTPCSCASAIKRRASSCPASRVCAVMSCVLLVPVSGSGFIIYPLYDTQTHARVENVISHFPFHVTALPEHLLASKIQRGRDPLNEVRGDGASVNDAEPAIVCQSTLAQCLQRGDDIGSAQPVGARRVRQAHALHDCLDLFRSILL